MDPRQSDVTDWFDETYRTLGFKYLRPLEAYPIFLQLLEAKPGDRLLDVACGLGLLLKAAAMRGVVPAGIDISSSAIETARTYVAEADLRVGNVEALPFADGAFDLLTCIGALERFLDRAAALAEMRRVLKDDGRAAIMVRNAHGLGWKIWRQWLGKQNHAGHQDAMGQTAWRELLTANGFEILDVFMDQWTRQKIRKALRGFRRHDFREPEPVAQPLLSMRFAYEYIFILRKIR